MTWAALTRAAGRSSPLAQLVDGLALGVAGHGEDGTAGGVDGREGQRQAGVGVAAVGIRVAATSWSGPASRVGRPREEGGGVAVGADAQMDEIDTRARQQTLDRGAGTRPRTAPTGPAVGMGVKEPTGPTRSRGSSARGADWRRGRRAAPCVHRPCRCRPASSPPWARLRPRSRSGSRSRRQVLVTRLCGGPAREHEGEALPRVGPRTPPPRRP